MRVGVGTSEIAVNLEITESELKKLKESEFTNFKSLGRLAELLADELHGEKIKSSKHSKSHIVRRLDETADNDVRRPIARSQGYTHTRLGHFEVNWI